MPAEQIDLETRKRRALYRANHRGTKEMDVIIGKYAQQNLEGMDESTLGEFEVFLDVPDRDLEAWIMRNDYKEDGEFSTLVDRVRQFHGLKSE